MLYFVEYKGFEDKRITYRVSGLVDNLADAQRLVLLSCREIACIQTLSGDMHQPIMLGLVDGFSPEGESPTQTRTRYNGSWSEPMKVW